LSNVGVGLKGVPDILGVWDVSEKCEDERPRSNSTVSTASVTSEPTGPGIQSEKLYWIPMLTPTTIFNLDMRRYPLQSVAKVVGISSPLVSEVSSEVSWKVL
jgi:hypothetical protein